MALFEPEDFAAQIGTFQRLLGIDLGSRTIGLALSDVTRMVASPMETLPKGKFSKDLIALRAIIESQDVGGIVMGLPREMDGTYGKRAQITRAFVHNLLQELDIAVMYWDERLSTVAVERVLIDEADMTRKRRKEVVDKAAAAYILQGALDALAYQQPKSEGGDHD